MLSIVGVKMSVQKCDMQNEEVAKQYKQKNFDIVILSRENKS